MDEDKFYWPKESLAYKRSSSREPSYPPSESGATTHVVAQKKRLPTAADSIPKPHFPPSEDKPVVETKSLEGREWEKRGRPKARSPHGPDWEFWEKVKSSTKNSTLVFMHTPKCGGSSINKNLGEKIGIELLFHTPPRWARQIVEEQGGILFTIIRNPVDRMVSLLNYRLQDKEARQDWPKRLRYANNNRSVTIDEVVDEMKDEEFFNFRPFNTLKYWTRGEGDFLIVITMDQFKDFLNFFGYLNFDYDAWVKDGKVNVSRKFRGGLSERNRKRLEYILSEDMAIYQRYKTKE